MPAHDRLYEHARYYDVAFGFRNVPAEMDLLLALHRELRGRDAESFLELAAGPAAHAREAAHRGLRAVAVDLSEGMRRYANDQAARERVYLDYRLGDMRGFALGAPCDLAALLMDSASYLLDEASTRDHLRATAAALEPCGVYVVEIARPGAAVTSWTSSRDGIEVEFTWGCPEDAPGEVTVRMRYRNGSRQGEVVDLAPQRAWSPEAWRAVVEASGAFRTARELGGLEPGRDWRYVSVLQKLG